MAPKQPGLPSSLPRCLLHAPQTLPSPSLGLQLAKILHGCGPALLALAAAAAEAANNVQAAADSSGTDSSNNYAAAAASGAAGNEERVRLAAQLAAAAGGLRDQVAAMPPAAPGEVDAEGLEHWLLHLQQAVPAATDAAAALQRFWALPEQTEAGRLPLARRCGAQLRPPVLPKHGPASGAGGGQSVRLQALRRLQGGVVLRGGLPRCRLAHQRGRAQAGVRGAGGRGGGPLAQTTRPGRCQFCCCAQVVLHVATSLTD